MSEQLREELRFKADILDIEMRSLYFLWKVSDCDPKIGKEVKQKAEELDDTILKLLSVTEEDNQWEPERSAMIRIGAIKPCFDCKETINTDNDCYLFSRPNIVRARYRCERCGRHHQKFLKAEFGEKWFNVDKTTEPELPTPE